MKHKCLDCGHIGDPAPPKATADGTEDQPFPACTKCGSEDGTKVG